MPARCFLTVLLLIGLVAPSSLAAGRGPGTTSASALPAFTYVAANGNQSCAVTVGGGVKCWGDNWARQLGDGTTTPRAAPVDVAGLSSGVTSIAVGFYHGCALTTGGGLKCWGWNVWGQLGNGTTYGGDSPVDVSGLTSGVTGVVAGEGFTCAAARGAAKCWGKNEYGQLGDGTISQHPAPADVKGLATGVLKAAAGDYHACALTTAGAVKCWGQNSSGQLGDGTRTNRSEPVDFAGLEGGVIGIAAGAFNSCALMVGGGVKCWGSTGGLVPTEVTGLPAGVTSLATSSFGTCALTSSGGLKCWYRGAPTPTDVAGVTEGVMSVGVSRDHMCAVAAGRVKCWGSNLYGQLGDGTLTRRTIPMDIPSLAGGLGSIALGDGMTCSVTGAGGVKCWGGWPVNSSTPIGISGLTSISAVAAGGQHACALDTGGGVRCWGSNSRGQLGDGTTTFREAPVPVSGLSSGVAAIVAGTLSTCALLANGAMKCWGSNSSGQLGDGSTGYRSSPVDVSDLGGRATAVVAGAAHACALLEGGALKCWGANGNGQLGDASTTDRLVPVQLSGLASGVVGVTAGANHTCALNSSGGVECWGSNMRGQLGDGTITGRSTPGDVAFLGSGVAAIAAGGEHTCALLTSGWLKCWGRNRSGEIGDGTLLAGRTEVTAERRLTLCPFLIDERWRAGCLSVAAEQQSASVAREDHAEEAPRFDAPPKLHYNRVVTERSHSSV